MVIEADSGLSLEKALAKTQSDAEALMKAAAAVTSAAKRLKTATLVGDLRTLPASIAAAEQAIAALRQQFANTKDGWDFDEDTYFGDGSFVRELQETAQRLSVRIYEQDDRLYCYPSLVRMFPSLRAVEIDKKRQRGLRPTVLVERLKNLQEQPPRFKPELFLESLFGAYETIATGGAKKPGDLFGQGQVIRLLDIYRVLTLFPGQSREYARPEFARDIYLLDQSGVTRTKGGFEASFPVGSGTRAPASTIRVDTQDGREKLYYGLTFNSPS